MTNKWLLISTSAILYPLSFIYPEHIGWMSFFSLIGLFIATYNYKLSFKEGFFWGLTIFFIHEFSIFYSLFFMAENHKIYVIFLTVILFLLQALITGIWFWLTTKIINLIKISNKNFNLTIWILSIWLYFLFITDYLFIPFNRFEGLILLHPLLPMIQFPSFLFGLPFLGKSLLTLCFLLSIEAFVIALYTKNIQKYIFYALAAIPWILNLSIKANFSGKSQSQPKFLHEMAYIPESFYNPSNNKKTFDEVSQKIKNLLEKYPLVNIVLLPESALYLCNLKEESQPIKKFCRDSLAKKIHIITGAFRQTKQKKYNTVYWIYDGQIKAWHDKKHSMLLTENLPNWAKSKWMNSAFFKDRPYIDPSSKPRKTFELSNNLKLIPYICSEIFFQDKPDIEEKDQKIVLSFCNDTWISDSNYLTRLMELVNQFRAIQWQTDLIYISYSNGFYFSKKGNKIPLLKL